MFDTNGNQLISIVSVMFCQACTVRTNQHHRNVFRGINKYTITLCVWMKQTKKHVISGFRRKVDENCALLGYYAASSGNSLPKFRDNLLGPTFQGRFYTLEDEADR
jgi:hypothetical protein